MDLGPPLWVLMAVLLFLCIFLHLCSPLPPAAWPSQVFLPLISTAPVPKGCLGRAVASCGGGGGPGVGPPSNAAPSPHQHSSRGPPAPTNTGFPSSESPPSSLCLPPFLLPAFLPASLPPSSLPPRLPDPARAGSGQAGRQAGGGLGGEKERWWQRAAVAAGSREAGPSGDQEPVAAPRRGPGVRGQALPPRPYTRHPRDTPPSSALLFHLLLFILSSLVLSHLPISPPRLPPSQLSGSPSTPSSPAPPLFSLSLPPACFFHGG